MLIAGLGLIMVGRVTAQTFTTLHNFSALSGITNSDGKLPDAGLILSGNTLYGTANNGGSADNGTVFRVNTDGSSFTNLHSFTAFASGTNSDGADPRASLLISGTNLYGTAYEGGSSDCGTVFRVNTDGTDFTNLHSFPLVSGPYPPTNSDGAFPLAGLVLSGSTLYGTAADGGTNGCGTVFAINTDGTRFTNLYTFTASSGSPATNRDGVHPSGTLILAGNILYGTAYQGGTNGSGTVFALNANGTVFTNLYTFAATHGYPYTNNDGDFPYGGLILSGDTLYGTAENGGSSGNGTVFAVNTNGTGFTNLYNFTANPGPNYTNTDGVNPEAGLILSGKTLYGTAPAGGNSEYGTVFALNTDGTGFMNLYNFTAEDSITGTNRDGADPSGGLISSGKTLYGTASHGGNSSNGTVFGLSLAPQLAIMLSGINVILTWPTNATGFTLEFATNLVPSAVWNTNLPAPSAINGTNTVTNAINGTQKFYRLSQ
jgi:uncharacterized repeat protein (TIGR03803 family)